MNIIKALRPYSTGLSEQFQSRLLYCVRQDTRQKYQLGDVISCRCRDNSVCSRSSISTTRRRIIRDSSALQIVRVCLTKGSPGRTGTTRRRRPSLIACRRQTPQRARRSLCPSTDEQITEAVESAAGLRRSATRCRTRGSDRDSRILGAR